MVCIKQFAKNMSLKISSPFASPFYCLKTLVTMLSKCFWVFFIHEIDFKISQYVSQYIKKTSCKSNSIRISLLFFLKC